MLNVIIPIIKRPLSVDIGSIIRAQPMTETDYSFSFVIDNVPKPSKEGDIKHVFSKGWQRFYGGEWIDEALWLKIKICGL